MTKAVRMRRRYQIDCAAACGSRVRPCGYTVRTDPPHGAVDQLERPTSVAEYGTHQLQRVGRAPVGTVAVVDDRDDRADRRRRLANIASRLLARSTERLEFVSDAV